MKYIKYLFAIYFVLILNTFAQEMFKVVLDTTGKQMLVGTISREAFKDTAYSWWFNSEYENYIVKLEGLDSLTSQLNEYSIIAVIGTWCSDSRHEIPRLLKILDSLNYNEKKLTMISVDRDKKGISDEVDGLNIELVPSIIFYKDGEEKGRIVEAPTETLEADIKEIITH